jgi:hypothetical protein
MATPAFDLIVPFALSLFVHAAIALPVLGLCAACLWFLPWTDEELDASADALRALRGAGVRVASTVRVVAARHGVAPRAALPSVRAPRGLLPASLAAAASVGLAAVSAFKSPL